MFVIEFLVFVISSGLFFSERFRGKLWAVIAAGAIATGSSLMFFYDVGVKVARHGEPPAVQIVRQVVVKKVAAGTTTPASAGRSHTCGDEYPQDSLAAGEQGTTALAFKILTDGTVDAVKVVTSSGFKRLDDAAVKCVAGWHYRPAIRNGKLAETDWNASVKWSLPVEAQKAVPDSGKTAWELIRGLFGSSSDEAKDTVKPSP